MEYNIVSRERYAGMILSPRPAPSLASVWKLSTRQVSDVLQPRADISGTSSNLDGWGFVLGPKEAACYRAWSRTRGREVARNAKQHERWSKLLQDAPELERAGSFGSNAGGARPTEPPRQRKGFHELVLSGVPGSLPVCSA